MNTTFKENYSEINIKAYGNSKSAHFNPEEPRSLVKLVLIKILQRPVFLKLKIIHTLTLGDASY